MAAAACTVLAGDIGGTSTRLALFEAAGDRIELLVSERFASREATGLAPLVGRFRSAHGDPIATACFGVAGPVVGGRVETSNLAWDVDAAVLARELGLPGVALINDLEANAHGIFALTPADFVVLNAGAADAAGNVAVISAGTGLGEAAMYWDGQQQHPFASEGGHTSFAPASQLQVELWHHLCQKLGGHVSWERVVSGPGLVNIYEFLRDSGRGAEPEWLTRELRSGDAPAAISKAALAGTSPLCEQALDLFVAAYGAEAGNLALTVMATGGVYVGGGIAPKIVPKLTAPPFMDAFVDKGRMRGLLERVPVRVIANEHTALFGAARYAAREARRATARP
jgi:glucokinase